MFLEQQIVSVTYVTHVLWEGNVTLDSFTQWEHPQVWRLSEAHIESRQFIGWWCEIPPQRNTFTFMHLADAFIQSDLQYHSGFTFFCQYVCSLGIEPTTFALLT